MKALKKTLIAVLAAGSLLISQPSTAGIQGSGHDFSTQPWNPEGVICKVCHTPHNADPYATGTVVPLWNRDFTVEPYVMYTSESLNCSIDSSPNENSLVCLSCHDGTIPFEEFGPPVQSEMSSIEHGLNVPIRNEPRFSSNKKCSGCHKVHSRLRQGAGGNNQHPISIVYDTFAEPNLKDIVLVDLPLYNGRVECSTCHNVHNESNYEPLLRKDHDDSSLCLTCHFPGL